VDTSKHTTTTMIYFIVEQVGVWTVDMNELAAEME
jgi:hypothetical protein